LHRRRLSRLCGELGVGVDIIQRKVPPDIPDIAEVGEQFADDRLCLAAVRAQLESRSLVG
jgi:hypothetical protein